MNESFTGIESLLREKIGLDAASVSSSIVRDVIREEMRAAGITDEAAYLARLSADPDEFDKLVDAVVVLETWFFRDIEPFVFLKQYVLTQWLPAQPRGALRILSMPCSTGEEPYSIAMTLLDMRMAPGDFSIDAVDVSRKALEQARRSVYRKASFRGDNQDDLRRYFLESDDGCRMDARVRQQVRFIHGNALTYSAPANPGGAGKSVYDIIFCRNLLIYFSGNARRILVRNLDSLLAPGGLLFLGHAEPPHIFFPDYQPVNHPRAFAARKIAAPANPNIARVSRNKQAKQATLAHARSEQRPRAPRAAPALRAERKRGSGSKPLRQTLSNQRSNTREPARDTAAALEQARRLADGGELAEAARLSTDVLQTDATCAEAYYILGVIAQAANDENRSEEHFQKTLYLQPDHAHALIHLSLLMEKRGLREQAEQYRKRALRVTKLENQAAT